MNQDSPGISGIEGLQGLRFLAVLFVLLFHLKIETFTNGFLGVDIFFVISGFIVTRIYVDRITSKAEILRFLVKRFCRIVPMMVIVSVVSIFAAALVFPPAILDLNAEHFFSALLFVSNFVFWGETGYFDFKSEYKLFLHTWSLSVEWQFYVLFPVLVLILCQFSSKRFVLIFVAFCCAVSWVLFLVFQNYVNVVFYTLPFRGWEFAAGCLIALLSGQKSAQHYFKVKIPAIAGGGGGSRIMPCSGPFSGCVYAFWLVFRLGFTVDRCGGDHLNAGFSGPVRLGYSGCQGIQKTGRCLLLHISLALAPDCSGVQ